MNKYVIAAGGSGALCVQGLVHMAASGCLNREDVYYILLIDKDQKSDAVENCKRLVGRYNVMRKMMGNQGNLVLPMIVLDGWGFSDELVKKWNEDNRSINPLSNTSVIKLRELLNPDGRDSENVLLDMLFTKTEQNENLDNGFYGHPCIGSAVFMYVKDRLFEDNGIFMQKLMGDMRSGSNTHLLVYGSLFGGTGASVIPNVVLSLYEREAQIIAERKNDNGRLLKIGGVFLLPYFAFPTHKDDGQHLNPDEAKFEYQTREALNYYHVAGIGKKMECICLLGAEHLDVTAETYAKGGEQKQHGHIVTMAAAVAGVKFLNGDIDWKPSDHEPERPDERLFTWKVSEDRGENSLDMDALGMTDYEIDKKMLTFLGFAVMINNYLNYLYNGKGASEAELLDTEIIIRATMRQEVPEGKKIESHGVITECYKRPIEVMAKYCRDYMEFILDVALSGYDWSSGTVQMQGIGNRFVDIVNIATLQHNLELDQKGDKYLDVLRSKSLKELTTFKTLDGDEKQSAAHAEDIVDTYDYALNSLPIKTGGFLGIGRRVRDDLSLSEILQKLYDECTQ